MRTGTPETRSKRTWYGLTAQVTLGARFLHRSGFDGVGVPHPPLVNGLLRIGLPDEAKRRLSFFHEFAHFQTAPLLLAYLLGIFFLVYAKGKIGIGMTIFLLICVHAAWEMLSEGLVILEDPAAYRKSYRGITKLPRVAFLIGGGMLTAAGWAVVLCG